MGESRAASYERQMTSSQLRALGATSAAPLAGEGASTAHALTSPGLVATQSSAYIGGAISLTLNLLLLPAYIFLLRLVASAQVQVREEGGRDSELFGSVGQRIKEQRVLTPEGFQLRGIDPKVADRARYYPRLPPR